MITLKKIYSVIFFTVFFLHGFAQQQVHVKYLHVRSPIATLYEDLYIKGDHVISIQDSIININTSGTLSAIRKSNKPFTKNYFISKNKNSDKVKDFFFTADIRDTEYFIHDNVAIPNWKIDKAQTKKILGYSCLKATAKFRGTNVTAYFTKELPYSAGPYKFYGLPGVILDIREDNNNYNIWKAEKVELNIDTKINFNPQFNNYPKINMKEFIEIKEGIQKKEMSDILAKMPEGTKMESGKPKNRPGLEKVFEWEIEK